MRTYVDNGALDFTLTFGTVTIPVLVGGTGDSRRVIKWNGLYNGAGGAWKDASGNDITIPAKECDNFWEMVDTLTNLPCTSG